MQCLPYATIVFFILHLAEGFQGDFWDISYAFGIDSTALNFHRNVSLSMMSMAFQKMKIYSKDIKFIFVNGCNHYQGCKKIYNITKDINKLLYQEFPDSTVLPILGTCDLDTRSQFDENSKWCHSFYNDWEIFFKTAEKTDVETFKRGCFYSRSVESTNGDALILVLNTKVWYKTNKCLAHVKDPLNQFEWMVTKLEKANKTLSNKVFLLMHAPPGASELDTYSIKHFHPKFNKVLLEIMQNYSSIIEAGFFSHLHSDGFKIVKNSKDTPIIPFFQSGSISSKLKRSSSSSPSFRLYQWKVNEMLRQYFQFHTDLTFDSRAATKKQLEWTVDYNSSSVLSSLAVRHVDDLIRGLKNESSTHFISFRNNFVSVRFQEHTKCLVNESCRCHMICSMENMDFQKLDSCLFECPHKISLLKILILTLSMVFIMAFFCVLYFLPRFCCSV